MRQLRNLTTPPKKDPVVCLTAVKSPLVLIGDHELMPRAVASGFPSVRRHPQRTRADHWFSRLDVNPKIYFRVPITVWRGFTLTVSKFTILP